MKKIYLFLLFAASAVGAYAQSPIKAGTVQLGGNIGYSQQNNDSPYTAYTGSNYYTSTTQHYTAKSFSVSPSAGYFVTDNLAIGLNAGYIQATTTYSYDHPSLIGNEQKNKQFSMGGFIQYYRMLTDQFGLTGTLGASYNHTTTNFTAGSFTSSSGTGNGYQLGLTPGLVFFPIPRFAVGASVGSVYYLHNKVTMDNTGNYGYPPSSASSTFTASVFGTNFGLSSLAFSGTYYFGR